jgi:putative addiction module component (TIGR02574 family)
MSAQAITEGFRKLAPDAKIRLLQGQWDEIADESASMPLGDSERQLLDERLRQHKENPEDVEPWDRVRNEILSEL